MITKEQEQQLKDVEAEAMALSLVMIEAMATVGNGEPTLLAIMSSCMAIVSTAIETTPDDKIMAAAMVEFQRMLDTNFNLIAINRMLKSTLKAKMN